MEEQHQGRLFISNWRHTEPAIRKRNGKGLLKDVVTQPVSVGICGSDAAFQLYLLKGSFSRSCSMHLDHAMLTVGQGFENGVNYWILKISWETSWG
ncbi:cysteine proteinase COT44-like [Papaver somniferum]|uniref:cysteine proteinase COT44-like n=1 Tax=Papaver somniferum TaxID=3469 RepID=UPI000E6F82C7|nr:cysteine proteinase COT44-like [Papaver somniferum]